MARTISSRSPRATKRATRPSVSKESSSKGKSSRRGSRPRATWNLCMLSSVPRMSPAAATAPPSSRANSEQMSSSSRREWEEMTTVLPASSCRRMRPRLNSSRASGSSPSKRLVQQQVSRAAGEGDRHEQLPLHPLEKVRTGDLRASLNLSSYSSYRARSRDRRRSTVRAAFPPSCWRCSRARRAAGRSPASCGRFQRSPPRQSGCCPRPRAAPPPADAAASTCPRRWGRPARGCFPPAPPSRCRRALPSSRTISADLRR